MVVGMGVLLGAASISIDVGSLYAQRRQVQNGADAAAFALAQTCVESPSACNASSAPSLSTLAGNNGRTTLNDSASTPAYANGICVKNLPASTPTDLPLCADPSGTFVDCPALPTVLAGVAYVEVHAQTLVNGVHLLPPIVAHTLGFNGANVQGCARVAFGPVSGLINTLPIGMSYCDWQSTVGYVNPANPGTFQNPPSDTYPGYGGASDPAWPATQVAVQTAKDATYNCPTWNGHTAPGGFSWLNQTGAGCSANVVGGWVFGVPGNSYQCDLPPYYGKLVYLPIFDCVTAVPVDPIISTTDCQTAAHGSSATNYHIVGYVSFYLSGWKFSSNTTGSIKPSQTPPNCPGTGGSGRCIIAWFTHRAVTDLPLAPSNTTTPAFGPDVVQAAG
jgi:Putative Flp pilus-assembly TadE/G-like